jgi:hypothetical protein
MMAMDPTQTVGAQASPAVRDVAKEVREKLAKVMERIS